MGWSQSRNKAEKDLKDAQQNGLDRTVWEILVGRGAQFLEDDGGYPGEEYKDEDESTYEYISRMIGNGIAREKDDIVYITLDDITLEFAVTTGHVDTVTENVTFFPGIGDIVEVRYNHFDLDYQGWIDSADLPSKTKYAKRPYKVMYQVSS